MTDDRMSRLEVECGRTFTPSTPINKRSFFKGRLPEIGKIVDAVNSAGKHAILYGDRGIGKTSLASILKELFADHPQVRIEKINCEANDNFASVWDKALGEINVNIERMDGTDEFYLNQWLSLNEYVGPGQIRKVIQRASDYVPELVIVFDEFDRLAIEHRIMFADTIKDLSDNFLRATIVLVGVASHVTELLAEHISVARNISQIKMPPMNRSELRDIIHTGLSKLEMTMAVEAVEIIETLAQGYPHYVHLLCKEAALSAIRKRRYEINTVDVYESIKIALDDNSYNIADVYHKATLQNRRGTLYELVLISSALAEVDELGFFSSTDVKLVLNSLSKKQYEIYGFSQHLDAFSSDVLRGPVFDKRGSRRCYRYRFANPLLRPYAIIKGMNDGIVTIDALKRMGNPVKRKKPARAPRMMPTPKHTKETPNLFSKVDDDDQT